jgi:hypothetical protein
MALLPWFDRGDATTRSVCITQSAGGMNGTFAACFLITYPTSGRNEQAGRGEQSWHCYRKQSMSHRHGALKQ